MKEKDKADQVVTKAAQLTPSLVKKQSGCFDILPSSQPILTNVSTTATDQ